MPTTRPHQTSKPRHTVRRIQVAVAILIGLGAAREAQAQGAVSGTIIEDGSRRPLAGVEVLLDGTDHATVTDSAGRYILVGLPTGRRFLVFRMVGYRPVRSFLILARGDTIQVDGTMVAEGVRLDSITVTGRPVISMGLDGFAERRSRGFGKFFDSTELRRRDQMHTADLLGRFASIEISRQPGAWLAFNKRRNCAFEIRLDGAVIGGGAFMTPPDLRSFGVSSLAAVEIYQTPGEVPLEYGGRNASCGVILLWTRRGR